MQKRLPWTYEKNLFSNLQWLHPVGIRVYSEGMFRDLKRVVDILYGIKPKGRRFDFLKHGAFRADKNELFCELS